MNAPGHVLMTADTVGGVWSYSLQLARALSAFGTRVSLATMGGSVSAEQRAEALGIFGLNIHEGSYRLEWMDDPWADIDAAGQWLQSLAARLKPDLIHLNGYAQGGLRWDVPCIVVAHSCVFSWWNAVLGEDPPPDWAEYKRRVGAGLQNADLVISISHAMADCIAKHYDVRGSRVIYNARDPAEYVAAHKEPLILTSGRVWDKAKNIRAVDAIAADLPWPVFLAGDAANPNGGSASTVNLRRLGKLSADELRAWFGKASIYALPALYEPFGLSVLEAALSECALVLGDITSLRELWDGAAVFVDPLEPHALRKAINDLIESPGRRQELGARARQRALQFSTERMACEYLAAYSEAKEAVASCAS